MTEKFHNLSTVFSYDLHNILVVEKMFVFSVKIGYYERKQVGGIL